MVLATAFFAHETVAIDNWTSSEINQVYQKQKKEALVALKELKEASKTTKEYIKYKEKADVRDKTFALLNAEIESYKFGSYKTFQQWLGEFDWGLGLFIYSLFNLILSFIRKTKTHFGEITLHFTIITIAIFFIHYTFQRHDFSDLIYLLMNIGMGVGCVVSAYLFVRYKEEAYNKLQMALNAISRFAFIGVKKYIDPAKIEDYKKDSIKALKDGM